MSIEAQKVRLIKNTRICCLKTVTVDNCFYMQQHNSSLNPAVVTKNCDPK